MKQFFVSVFVFSILVVPGLTVSANDIQQWQVGETVTTVFNDAGQYEETMYTITLTEDQLVTFTLNDTFYNVFVALKTAEGEPITVLRGHSLSDTPNETTMRVQLRKGTYYATLSGRDTKQAAASYTIAPLVSPYNIKPNDSEERANHIPTNTIKDIICRMPPSIYRLLRHHALSLRNILGRTRSFLICQKRATMYCQQDSIR